MAAHRRGGDGGLGRKTYTTKGESAMNSPKRLARIAGVLYLLNGITSGFAFAYVVAKVYIVGDAATTAANVATNAGLVRIGGVADLFQATIWIFLALTLYGLLRHVNQNTARAMVPRRSRVRHRVSQ